ncbi:MAG: type B 50S ribosomal protein L31 [Planctomycetes bacterium]|nr:type B 50S ribosomal protein L31 [Planctomycetota bacterium]
MKEGIHPQIRKVVFQDTITGSRYVALSAVKAEHTVSLDGTEYPLVKIDVSASSHPFYTGNQRILDIAGRVEKFGNRYGNKVSAIQAILTKKK